MKKNTSGFTLVELVVTIAVASLVFGAAAVLLISGMRTHRILSDTSQNQMTIKLIDETLENISHKSGVKVADNTVTADGFTLKIEKDEPESDLATYSLVLNGVKMIDGKVDLAKSGFSYDGDNNHILRYKITVKRGDKDVTYSGAVYFPNSELSGASEEEG